MTTSKNNPVCCDSCWSPGKWPYKEGNDVPYCMHSACECHKEWKVLKDTDTEHIAVLVSPKITAPDAWEKELRDEYKQDILKADHEVDADMALQKVIEKVAAQARADTVAEVLGIVDEGRHEFYRPHGKVPVSLLQTVEKMRTAISRLVDREETV